MSSDLVPLTVPSTTAGIVYSPADAWDAIAAPGATNGQADFLLGDSVNGLGNAFITYTFPEAATGLQYWGYQRSNGGLFSICFDCLPTSLGAGTQIDALNASTNGSEPPRLLFQTTTLSYAVHNLTLTNLFDPRATIGNATNGAFGQMSLDRFVLFAPSTPPTSTSSSTSSASAAGASATTSSASTTTTTSTPTGAIAGGVVGGIAVLALIIFLIWFLRRRSRLRQSGVGNVDMGAGENEEGKVTYIGPPGAGGTVLQPFVLGMPQQQGSGQTPDRYTYGQWQGNAPTSTYASPPGQPSPPTAPYPSAPYPPAAPGAPPSIRSQKLRQQPFPVNRASAPQPQPSPSQGPTSPSIYPLSDTSGSSATAIQGQPRRERDAGWLAGDDGDDGEPEQAVLPPDYEDAVRRRREGGR